MSVDTDFQTQINNIYGESARKFTTSDYNFLHTVTKLYGNAMSAKGLNLLDPIYTNLFHYNKLQNVALTDYPRVTRAYVFFTRPELNFSFENIQSIPFFKWLFAKPIGKMVMSALTDPDYFINAPSQLNSSDSLTPAAYMQVLNSFKNELSQYSTDVENNTKLSSMMDVSNGVQDYSSQEDQLLKEEERRDNNTVESANPSDLAYGTSDIASLQKEVNDMNNVYGKFNSSYTEQINVIDKMLDNINAEVNKNPNSNNALNIYLAKNIMRTTHNSSVYDKFNYTSPFIPLLGNTCTSLTGAKGFNLESYSYEEDEFSGSLQVATGMDSLWNNGSFTTSFDDISYGPVNLLFTVWMMYIHYVSRGYISTTRSHVTERILDYTCSAYVFIIGADGRSIERFCKYTGCYPETYNLDSQLDFSKELDPEMLRKLQIGWKYNRFEPMNPEIFTDFNYLSESEWLFRSRSWKNMYDRKSDLATGNMLDSSRMATEREKILLRSTGRSDKIWDVVSDPGMSGKVPRALINGTAIDDGELSETDMISNYWGGYPYINKGSEFIWVLPRFSNSDSQEKNVALSKWNTNNNLNIDIGNSNSTNASTIKSQTP